MMRVSRLALVLFCVSLCNSAVTAQKSKRVVAIGESRVRVADARGRVQTLELDSRFLKRKVWMSVFLPEFYFDRDQSGRRFPVVYLLHGLGGRFDNWSTKTSLANYLSDRKLIVVTPEGADGWYTDSATRPSDKFETYMIEEVLPEIDHRYRTIAEGRARAMAGLSMGGFGAIKFGLKYPHLFSLIGSFSGALDAPLRGQDHKNWRPSIMTVFGPDGSPVRKANDVFALVDGMAPERLKALPYFYISCGTEDTVNFRQNFDFASLLIDKKVPHQYRHFPGAHTWTVWNSEVGEFLELAAQKL
jgi:S-formylglutathione hydrolase FrmB